MKDLILFGQDCPGLEIKSDTKALLKALKLNDDYYLLAVNPTSDPQKNIQLNLPAGWRSPKSIIGAGELKSTDAGYKLELKGYGAAVYKFD